MPVILNYISNSKKGVKRERNQDRITIIENKNFYLFMVLDGVSSLPLSYTFINEFNKKLRFFSNKYNLSENNLQNILYQIHNEVLSLGINGMSTLSVLFFNKLNKKVSFLNIGDSRIYIFTNRFLEKITIDDSLAGRKNVITKCLGLESLTLEDFELKNMDSNYNFLLCSDGFYELMENDLKEYFITLNFKNIKNIKNKLSSLQRRKNKDDSSYIIVKNEI